VPLGRHIKHPRPNYPERREWLPLHDAAVIAHVRPSALRREILESGMPARKVADGWLIHRDVLEIFIQTRAAHSVLARENPRPKVSNGE
jgi:hypothetical protein